MLDPEIFRTAEEVLGIKFPDRGTPILARNRNGNVVAGVTGNIWMALDVVCIDIEILGGTFRLFPELGDTFITWRDYENLYQRSNAGNAQPERELIQGSQGDASGDGA